MITGKRKAAPLRITRQHLDYLRQSYSEGSQLFGSEAHETWVVDITEAAPALFAMVQELLTREAAPPRKRRR